MKIIDDEIQRLRAELARVQAELNTALRIQSLMQKGPDASVAPAQKKRAANVKPLVIDMLYAAGPDGATSVEVAAAVRLKEPNVAKDTVGSVLSRLKSDGALAYDGERYYIKKLAPVQGERPFDLRAVN